MTKSGRDGPSYGGRFPVGLGFFAVLLLFISATVVAVFMYRHYGPSGKCPPVPASGEVFYKEFIPSAEEAAPFLASRADLACPGTGQFFFEWYFLNVHMDKYWVEASFHIQGSDSRQPFAAFKICSAKTLKPLIVEIAEGRDIKWSDSGNEISMITVGPDGKDGRSYLRYLPDEPHAGSFELRILTRKRELHIYLKPKSPGIRFNSLYNDPTLAGTWFQATIFTLMGEVEGEFNEFMESGTQTRSIPEVNDKTARGYLEHVWGQGDHRRFSWDWAEFGDPEMEKALFFFQSNKPYEGIGSIVVASNGLELPLKIIHNPPEQFFRVIYARLFSHKGLLHPQQLHLWGFDANSPDNINMTGFSHGFYKYHTAFNLFGAAGGDVPVIDWSISPEMTAVDHQLGRKVQDLHPPPPESLKKECDKKGCRLEWSHPGAGRENIEYWIFRIDNGSRMDEGKPVGMVEYLPGPEPSGGGEKEILKFRDPSGSSESIYKLAAVSVPDNLVHKRLQAGHFKCTGPPTLSAPVDPDPFFVGALDRSRTADFTGPQNIHVLLPEIQEGGPVNFRMSLENDKETDALMFIMEKQEAGQWIKIKGLPPRFTPGVQVQSFSAVTIDPERLAVAWSERSLIMDRQNYTEWEVFVAFVDTETGAFRVLPVSMSEKESVGVSIKQQEHSIMVTWSECDLGKCSKASEKIQLIKP